ncbi:MAG: SRPBCC family protein [Acidobacteriota bacterium]
MPATETSEKAPDFVYVAYIAADAQRVWSGLMDHDLTQQYWGRHNVSDWTVGASWKHQRPDGSGIVDIVGEVIEIEPPRKLVVTWAAPKDAEDANKVSRVTYLIEALGPDTRLTITHSDLEAGSDMHLDVTTGWPAVACNLKTLLETGKTLSEDAWPKEEGART